LKSSIKKDEENDEDMVESSEYENLNLVIKKFGKYFKRKGNKSNQRRYNSKHNILILKQQQSKLETIIIIEI